MGHKRAHRVGVLSGGGLVDCIGHGAAYVVEVAPVGHLLGGVAPRVHDLLAVTVQRHVHLQERDTGERH